MLCSLDHVVEVIALKKMLRPVEVGEGFPVGIILLFLAACYPIFLPS
jgi:hypothetical protein